MNVLSPELSAVTKTGRFLTFSLGTESYGVDVLAVQEIIRMSKITPVPQLPEYLRGVINLRGRIIPVLDLGRRFQLPPTPDSERTCIIVLHLKHPNGRPLHMGMVVDTVEEVIQISAEDMSPPPEFATTVDTSFLLSIARVKGVVKTLLNIQRVLTDDQLVQASGLVAA